MNFRTLSDATMFFSNPQHTYKLMWKIRWPDNKPVCPACTSREIGSIQTRNLLRCKTCRKQFSLKSGTLFEESPLEIGQWFLCFYIVYSQQKMSCQKLADYLGVTIVTAWRMRRKLKAGLSVIDNSDSFDHALKQIIFLKKSHIYSLINDKNLS